jgi:hypothetical protein
MKRAIGLGMAVAVLMAAAALSRTDAPANKGADLRVDVEARNPWTHLRLNNGPDTFQFAIVSDRTGGHRARVFSRAVERLNLLQPAFVLSVGDLIEGYTEEKDKLAGQWKEFDRFVSKLQMPFFYLPGNHDLSNTVQDKAWKERYGRPYYHFVYRNVLFLLLNSEERVKKATRIGPEQIAYIKKALADNRDARWTIVLLHKPLWSYTDVDKNGWLEVEKALAGRRYTVFAGHMHVYRKFVRNGMSLYQLATTGGGSKLRGLRYGEFDHIAWVTMKKDGPVLANVLLDGVYPEDLSVPPSEEPGVPTKNRKKTHPCTGKVTLEGKPVPNATVVFYSYNKRTKKYARVADALAESDGTYVLSTYTAFDGVPAGEYSVTVTRHEPQFDETGKPTPNLLPDRYARPQTSPLKARAEAGKNTINLELSK